MNRSRVPDFDDRLSAARDAKKALLERAKAVAADPTIAERRNARDAVVANRKMRIAERVAAERVKRERQAAERAAAEAAELAAREAELRAEQEARAAREAERRAREAAARAEHEAI